MKKLLRKLFPVRVRYVPQFEVPDYKVSKEGREILPELAKAQENSPELFLWLVKRLTELEMQFHVPPGTLTKEGMEEYSTRQYGLSQQIAAIKEVLKVPSYASAILNKKEKAKKAVKGDDNTNWG